MDCTFAGEEPTPEVAAVAAFLERTHGQDGGTAWSNVRVLAGEDAALVVERYFSPKIFQEDEDGRSVRLWYNIATVLAVTVVAIGDGERQAEKIDRTVIESKLAAFRRATGEWRDCTPKFLTLSLEDM